VARQARQDLVRRLDGYEAKHTEVFVRVVDFIHHKCLPIIRKHAISGLARINTEDPLFEEPLALAMLIDIFSERGYHATVDIHKVEVPESVDRDTFKIHCRVKKIYRLRIAFPTGHIRRGSR
ncbi:MAG: adenylate kinase, partial [Verrucomicrobia bacterium 21-51-4]